MIVALLVKHWRIVLLLALIGGIFGAGWKIKSGIDQRAAENADQAAQIAALNAEKAALEAQLAAEKASAQAAAEARSRNDAVIPQVRRDTQARVNRVPGAAPAVRVQDDADALAAYAAAAGRVRGTSAR